MDEGLLDNRLRQVHAVSSLGIERDGAVVVEIGSGWCPILPLIYRYAGAGRVITVDRERLIDDNTFRGAVSFISNNLDRLTRRSALTGFDRPFQPDVTGGSLDEIGRAHV